MREMPPRPPRLSHARISGLLAAAISLVVAAPASAQLLSAPVTPKAATPDLIDRAEQRGAIDLERASLLRVYALKGDPRLPEAYESNRPWRGTLLDLQLRHDLPKLDPGPERTAVREALRAPPDPNATTCSTSATPLPNSIETANFYIQYNASAVGGGLTINDYAASLEEVFGSEVTSFRWAKPPQNATAASQIPGKYHVRVEPLVAGLYGFVSSLGTYAGNVGDNPNTTWNEGDADASCMVLNSDFDTGFPGTAQQALDATTAHEYNHSIQFGYGALRGANVPDDNIVEGGATWMEDEAQDAANDNYNYLYPRFDDSMGEHDTGDIYAYWLTFRGLTERFGANVPGGAEQVMQAFWEITSRNEGNMLTAMQQALAGKQRTLAETFHDYAVAAKHMRTCGGNYFLPYCFEEAAGYTTGRGAPPSHGTIASTPGSFSRSIEDNYTINWVTLPSSGPYNVTLSAGAGVGQLRGTLSCDTAAGIALAPFPAVVGPTLSQTVPGFDPSSCTQAPVAVITNQSQTAPNPGNSSQPYTLSTASPAGGPTAPAVPPRPSEVGPDNGPAPAQDPSPTGTTSGNTAPTPSITPLDIVDPVIGTVGFSTRRFRAARSGAAIQSAPLGTRARFRLSEGATILLRYERATSGRRVGGRCRALTRLNRGRTPCTRWVLVRGSARHGGRAGANSLRLTGRIGGRTLRPGVYRLRLTARDAAGNTSRVRRSPLLRVVRR